MQSDDDTAVTFRRAVVSALESMDRLEADTVKRIDALEQRERELTEDVAGLSNRIESVWRALNSRTEHLA